jgi:hypothetical protein
MLRDGTSRALSHRTDDVLNQTAVAENDFVRNVHPANIQSWCTRAYLQSSSIRNIAIRRFGGSHRIDCLPNNCSQQRHHTNRTDHSRRFRPARCGHRRPADKRNLRRRRYAANCHAPLIRYANGEPLHSWQRPRSDHDLRFTGSGAAPGDISVTASAIVGLFPNTIELDLQISSTTLPGVRTLFVASLSNDRAAASGILEVK